MLCACAFFWMVSHRRWSRKKRKNKLLIKRPRRREDKRSLVDSQFSSEEMAAQGNRARHPCMVFVLLFMQDKEEKAARKKRVDLWERASEKEKIYRVFVSVIWSVVWVKQSLRLGCVGCCFARPHGWSPPRWKQHPTQKYGTQTESNPVSSLSAHLICGCGRLEANWWRSGNGSEATVSDLLKMLCISTLYS